MLPGFGSYSVRLYLARTNPISKCRLFPSKSPQNFQIVQDNYGRILVGNPSGVLIFDGSDWSMIHGTEDLAFLYFARDNEGNIFTFDAGQNELGYIGVDKRGRSVYFSVSHFLPDSGRNVGQINAIVVAASSGVHKLWNNGTIVTIDVDARAILRTDYPEIIWVGLENGVGRIEVSGEKWRWMGKVPGISHDVRTMAFESDSILWASFEQISKIVFSDPREPNPETTTFGEGNGINENFFLIEPGIIQKNVLFGTGDGIYYYDPEIQKFRAETTFGAEFTNESAWALVEDFDENIWITSEDYDGIITHLTDGTYSIDSISLAPLFKTDIWKIIPQDKDIVWLCTTDGLYKYDKSQPKVEDRAFQALITRVEMNRDSIVTYLVAGTPAQDPEDVKDEFARSQNDIRFRFTAPSYYKDEVLKYAFKLEGYDKDWSVWAEEHQKEYTNLPVNSYQFRVKSTDLYGFISEEAIYSCRILPAWWETWLARVCFILFSILMIYLIRRKR